MSFQQRLSTKMKNSRHNVRINENETIRTLSKRQKKTTEKRLRRYRSTMTLAIYDRIERALNQRLYLLAINNSSNPSIHREYKVLGQTANVYTVTITHIPTCTCPDYAKGHLCKHIIFILHRVLKVDRNSSLLYQQALITSELNEIFAKADSQNNDVSVFAEKTILEAYHAKTGDPDALLKSKVIEQKVIEINDECPICFETMVNEKNQILFCSTSCGNNMHKVCFGKWCQAKLTMNEKVTCPFCRVEWKSISENKNNSDGYLNLAAYSTTNYYNDDWTIFSYY